jgi:NAD(P)-dependent dehydrogenase (short-subunit alcohol dehydrogenase family)
VSGPDRSGLLEGRVAVVTGGALGIGGGVSRAFADAGATVVVNDIDTRALGVLVDELEAAGRHVVPAPGDITDPDTVEALVATALASGGGRLDVLVNNVGDYRPNGRFLRTDEDRWQRLYEVNLLHVLRCTHAVAPTMVEQGGGSIVNVTTVEVHRGIPANALYSGYKAAVWAFSRSLAVELGGGGVRVNCLAPDMADTPQTPAEVMLGGRDESLVGAWIPLGRFGQPADYADVALFLASDQSRFVTGATIPVDGGTLAASGWYGRADGRGWTVLPDQP